MKKQQEEAQQQEAVKVDQRSTETSVSNNQLKSSSSKNNQTTTAKVTSNSSGVWTRPTEGYITSNFGWRTLNGVHEFTSGVDIAKAGAVPVVAAANGVVTYAGSMGTYGNVVMVRHSIDGQTYTTVYAHLNIILVGNSSTLSKGQMIGYMGSTGRVTGQHLHFELHKGSWNGSRSNVINPVGIVPL